VGAPDEEARWNGEAHTTAPNASRVIHRAVQKSSRAASRSQQKPMLPEFNTDGNLSEGIHRATEDEFLGRFAVGSARRKWLGGLLQELLALASSTGCLERVYVWGSFVSAKESPNDVDLLLLVRDDFQLENVAEEARVLFDHGEARMRFHADVFWSRSSIDQRVLALWLDTYQLTREFQRRGIVEVEGL
jgi:predicted nucleotidyltransferase